MNKMLNTATSLAYHHHHKSPSSSSSSSSSARTSSSSNSSSAYLTPSAIRRNLRSSLNNDDYHLYATTADLIGADYFVSSLDFEYDLFLNGLVNCDNSGYRNRIRQSKDLYDISSLLDQTTTNNPNNNNNNKCHKCDNHFYNNHHNFPRLFSSSSSSSSSKTSSSAAANYHHQDSSPNDGNFLFSALNSPLSRAATAYRNLAQHTTSKQSPRQQQQQHAMFNDFTNSGSTQNSYTTNKSNGQFQTSNSSQASSIPSSSTAGRVSKTSATPTTPITPGNNNSNSTSSNAVAMTTTTTSKCNNILTNQQSSSGSNSSATSGVPVQSNNQIIKNNQNNQNNEPSTDSTTSSSISPRTSMMLDVGVVANENDVILENGTNNFSHQHLHALHRFRQQKKKGLISRLKDVVISFSPKARSSVLVNCDEIYSRFGREEKDALDAFNFLNEFDEDDAVFADDDAGTNFININNNIDNDGNNGVDVPSDVDELHHQQDLDGEQQQPQQKVNERTIDDDRINLEMEEYDFIHPFTSYDNNGDDGLCCDNNNNNTKMNLDDEIELEKQQQQQQRQIRQRTNNNSSNQSTGSSNNNRPLSVDSGSVQIYLKSSSNDYDDDRFHHSLPTTTTMAIPETRTTAAMTESSSSNAPTKTTHHSFKQKFRFGFPRKSSSLEFNKTTTAKMKHFDEIGIKNRTRTASPSSSNLPDQDDPESIYGSHSVQEALLMNKNNDNKGNKNGDEANFGLTSILMATTSNNNNNNRKSNQGSRKANCFLAKNTEYFSSPSSSPPPSTTSSLSSSSSSFNQKKKNRSKKKSKSSSNSSKNINIKCQE